MRRGSKRAACGVASLAFVHGANDLAAPRDGFRLLLDALKAGDRFGRA
jgi:hypothetical protein